MPPTRNFPIGLTICAVLVLAAAFLPWGEIDAAPRFDLPFRDVGGDRHGNLFEGLRMTVTVTGWDGHLSLGGLRLPNWLVVLAAAGLAASAWWGRAGWKVPAAVPFSFAGYGLLHSGVTCLVCMLSGDASVGAGSLLTAASFAAGLAILVRRALTPGIATAGDRPVGVRDEQREVPRREASIDLWRAIMRGERKTWVLYENGTCVTLWEPVEDLDLASHATTLVRRWGPVSNGSPTGEFIVSRLRGMEGWVVTRRHPDVMAYVGPDEVSASPGETEIGLVGESKHDRDGRDPKVIHVEDGRR